MGTYLCIYIYLWRFNVFIFFRVYIDWRKGGEVDVYRERNVIFKERFGFYFGEIIVY